MIPLEVQIFLSIVLDLILGDPLWLPHPVRGIGYIAAKLEKIFCMKLKNQTAAGIFTWISIAVIFSSSVFFIQFLAGLIHPLFCDIVSIIIIYFTIAAKDLSVHGKKVFLALKEKDLKKARKRVFFMVSRDVKDFKNREIILATIESIAENIVDGITAPIFFAIIGGPVFAVFYRAINTLDSMFGYKNKKYINFGKISAIADDILNFLPARITSIFICFGSIFSGGNFFFAFKILLRDCSKLDSPNSGFSEAPVAGGLKIRLGGPAVYSGKIINNPYLGDDCSPITINLINKAITIMWATVFLFSLILLSISFSLKIFFL